MSLWTKFRDTAVRSVAAYYTGGLSETYFQAKDAAGAQQAQVYQPASMSNPTGMQRTIKGGYVSQVEESPYSRGGASATYQVRGSPRLRSAMRSAASYARRYPQWVGTLQGGMGAVAQMVMNGQLPPLKTRRRRGISAGDLSKFRRVAGFLHKWGGMVHGAARAPSRRRTTHR